MMGISTNGEPLKQRTAPGGDARDAATAGRVTYSYAADPHSWLAKLSADPWSWLPQVSIAVSLVIVLLIVVTSGDIQHGMTGAAGSGRYCSPPHRMPFHSIHE